jgi:hypothetical protein
MSDRPPVDDELATALVDGEATPEEQARLADDPALAARVEQLRAVRAMVGATPEPPPAEAREQAIRAALAEAALAEAATSAPVAAGAGSGPAAGSPPPLPPVDLDARRNRRRAWLPAAAAAAVALVLGFGALGALSGRDQGNDDVATFVARDGSTEGGAESDRAGENALAGGGATTTAGAATTLAAADAGGADPTQGTTSASGDAALAQLGPVDDEAALVAALQAARTTVAANPEPTPAPSTIATSEQPPPAAACPAPDGAAVVAEVIWQGQPAWVAVGGSPEVATVISAGDCAVLAEVRLA